MQFICTRIQNALVNSRNILRIEIVLMLISPVTQALGAKKIA
jgi:hypothetical protein